MIGNSDRYMQINQVKLIHSSIEKYYISKDTSMVIKGIAILLMIVHHMFTFPNWIIGGYEPNLLFAMYFNVPTRICVGMFAFITGWAFCIQEKRRIKDIFRKILSFYIMYWIVFIILLLFACVICGYKPDLIVLLPEILGLANDFMKFCWYVTFYAVALIVMFLIYKLLDRSLVCAIVSGLVFPTVLFLVLEMVISFKILADLVNDLKHYFPCIAVGYICNKYNIFGVIHRYTYRINQSILFAVAFALTFASRYYIRAFDFIYSPIIVYGIANLCDSKYRCKMILTLQMVLKKLGMQATNIWFIHCAIFCNATRTYIQPYIYLSSNALINLLVAMFSLYVCSSILTVLDKCILRKIGLN